MTNSYSNSLGGLFAATGPMAPSANDLAETVNFDFRPARHGIVQPAEFAFTSIMRTGNILTRIDFRCTIARDDDPSAPVASPVIPSHHC